MLDTSEPGTDVHYVGNVPGRPMKARDAHSLQTATLAQTQRQAERTSFRRAPQVKPAWQAACA
eukprot:5376677-Heterocapsa_arctica.AAC.1